MTTPMVDLIFEVNNCLLHVVSVEGNNLNPKNFFKFCATACAKELCRSGYVYNPNDRNGCPRCFYKNRTLLLGGILKTSKLSDNQSAGIAIAIAIVLIMTTLFLLTKVMSFGLKEQTSSWIKKALLRHAIVGMLVGCLVTMLIQASGITTSSMVPLVALNVITLEQMFPVALGANVGTTITAFFAALGEGEPSGLQIAICHFLFNFFGILVFYPIPYMRSLPLESSRALGYQVSKNRIYGILFILVVFFVIPGALLGLSFAKGGVIVGAVLLYGTLLFVFVWRQIRVRRPQWIPLWCPNVMKPNHREEEEAKEEMYEAKKDFSDNKSLDAMVPTNDNGNGENWELEEGSLRKTNESVLMSKA
ncbi:hypothetical protein MHBO_003140 [Bonamia ostreae]|uniref:Uncharacterized protein n=1 Tax=Bonamia ostreae TaxID=126728 RepID=A0ABV2APK4_9EUKA